MSDDAGPPLTGRETMDEVLEKSVFLDKESAIFRLGMKEAASRGGDRDRIDEIISNRFEEDRHGEEGEEEGQEDRPQGFREEDRGPSSS